MATAVMFDSAMAPNPRSKPGRQFGGAPLCPVYNNRNPNPNSNPSASPWTPGSPAKSHSSSLAILDDIDDVISNVSDQCSIGDDFSLSGSPTGSCHSEQGEKFPTTALEEAAWRQRRSSFEVPVHQAGNRLERRGFLPKRPPSSSPGGSGNSSPARGPYEPLSGSSPLFASPSNSSSFSPVRTTASAAQSSLAPSHVLPGPMTTASPQRSSHTSSGNSGKLPSLREQVLLRSSSGQSGELDPVYHIEDEDEAEVIAECMNLDDVETVCQEKELEKDFIDGIQIVPLPTAFSAPGMPEIVLYALYFTSKDTVPVLPGDDSIKLLFPQRLQNEAGGSTKRRGSKAASNPGVTAFKPFVAERPAKPSAQKKPSSSSSSYASFGSYKASS